MSEVIGISVPRRTWNGIQSLAPPGRSVPVVHIVDDEADVRAALRATVGSLNFDIVCHDKAEDFLCQYDDRRLGCAVVDLRLPGTSGLQLVKQLRQETPDYPAVILSGAATVPEAVEAMKWGAIDVLEKPGGVRQLNDIIVRAVQSQAAARQRATAIAIWEGKLKSLTAEEHQVAALTMDGEVDKRIASLLGISPRTVQLRRSSAMRKLSVGSKAELIRVLQAPPVTASAGPPALLPSSVSSISSIR